jgi:hypothetical protein
MRDNPPAVVASRQEMEKLLTALFKELAHGMEMEDVRRLEPSPPSRRSTCMILVICTISHVIVMFMTCDF